MSFILFLIKLSGAVPSRLDGYVFVHLVFDNFIKLTDNFIGSNVFHTYGSSTVSYYGSIC